MRHFTLASLAFTALTLGLLAASPSIAQTPAPATGGKMAPAPRWRQRRRWRRPPKADAKIDINTATKEELMAFKGIGDKYSDKIIAGRPYAKKDQLVSKNILPEATYKKYPDQIIATQPK